MSSKLKITNAADSKPVVWFYGEIGWDFNADDFRHALASVGDTSDIELRINSPGGSYSEAIAMHTNLVRRKGKTEVIVDGLAASGGSVVAMGGTTITMAQGSHMMIHQAHGATAGQAADFRKYADVLDSMNEQILQIYSKRWKGDGAALKAAVDAETWLTADEAVEAGLADGVGVSLALAAYVDTARFGYVKVPEELVAKPGVLPASLASRKAIVDELFSESEENESCEQK